MLWFHSPFEFLLAAGLLAPHCFPTSWGVGEGGWNKETDPFSPLLAKDA